MKPLTKTLAFIGGALGIAALGGASALGVQSLLAQKTEIQAPLPVPAAPVTQVAQAPLPTTPVAQVEVAQAPAPIPPPAPLPAVPVAHIVNVKPYYITVKNPVRECYRERHVFYAQSQPNVPGAGAVLGGIAGGLAGSAIHGKNHTAAVIAGTAIGAVSGNAMQQNMNQPIPQYAYTRHCETHYVSSKVKQGYEVTYFYNGQQGTLLMANPPIGNTIPAPY